MKSHQKKALEYYSILARDGADESILAGRYKEDSGKEQRIFNDIFNKLQVEKGDSFLDIGCGCSPLTLMVVDWLLNQDCTVTLIDIPAVISRLKKQLPRSSKIRFHSGLFPDDMPEVFFERKFKRICAYSVIQCLDEPSSFIESLVKVLGAQSKILIGDLPNINKKGRFLCSDFGRKFDADYQGVTIDELDVYKNHIDYAEKVQNQNKAISDQFIENTLLKYRKNGYNSFVMPQPTSLPFSYTREDLIIESL